MQVWSTVGTYAKWTLDFLIYPPFVFVTAGLLVAIAIAAMFAFKRDRELLRARIPSLLLGSFTVFLFAPSLLWLAALGAVDTRPPVTPNEKMLWIAGGLRWFSVAVSAYVFFGCKGVRWLALSVVLLFQWTLEFVGLMVAMALSGTWL